MNPLLAFYRGEAPDDRGRFVDEIVRHDDHWLEATHDFVQWLFPLPEPSAFNPGAPLLDEEVAHAFARDAALRGRLLASFERMLRFYGLERVDGRVRPAANWNSRKTDWFTRSGHNTLRITRILRSASLLGLRDEALALLACLEGLRQSEPACGIDARSWAYWRGAVETG